VTAKQHVPSLVDDTGNFYSFDSMSEFLAQVCLDQLETEFRAQIEVVVTYGLQPTHLDWHALRIGHRPDLFEVILGLAGEYGLAVRVANRSWGEELQARGLPTIDYDFLDSYGLDPVNKNALLVECLRNLPVGLSEWAVHPGLDSAELTAIEGNGDHIRQTDFDFLTSQLAKDVIQQEGIVLLDYRALQAVWKDQ
jgi:predicted glycoside hydrolase/deacetylase ChbG (UPF0249 family)